MGRNPGPHLAAIGGSDGLSDDPTTGNLMSQAQATPGQATAADGGVVDWVKSLPYRFGHIGPQLAIARRVSQRVVRERPEVPIAISFATGVLLGWLVKRR
jgi:ElaB/YqjD/DUF883 family membrane-anchored ribosome-binding protein